MLKERWGLDVQALSRLQVGQQADSFRVDTSHGIYFLKIVDSAHVGSLRAAIDDSHLARGAGARIAPALKDKEAEFVLQHDEHALAVFEWAEGRVLEGLPSSQQCTAIGEQLAIIHGALNKSDAMTQVPVDRAICELRSSMLAAQEYAASTLATYESLDPAYVRKCRASLAFNEGAFDQAAAAIAEDRFLGSCFLHGDYSVLNLLFDGHRRPWVTDFSGHVTGFITWELARIAFAPQFIAWGAGWERVAKEIINGYNDRTSFPPIAVRQCAAVFAAYLAGSLYGMTAHFGLQDDNLEEFWWQRQAAVRQLVSVLKTGRHSG